MIYENVKRACEECGETISGLEEKLKFPRGSICKWDRNTPSVIKVQQVAITLGKPIEFFLNETREVDE